MKVLYIAKGDLPDYQSDMVFHGLRSLYGSDCVDANKIWYMYKSDKELYWNSLVPNGGKSYGHGFTIHGKLPDCAVDRNDISGRVLAREFDLIVYGSVTRCTDYLKEVLSVYPPERVFYIDGEDGQNIDFSLCNTGVLFKREFPDSVMVTDRLRTIEFAIPESQIQATVPTKTKDWAHIIPGDLRTYIFDNERDYYADYMTSMFGLTHKKGGFCCLRHLEILACGCVPYFPGLDTCPVNTLTVFPKNLLVGVEKIILSGKVDNQWYVDTSDALLEYTKTQLTTCALAGRIVNAL